MLFNRDKVILDLCGGTGAWSKPYKDAGYDAQIVTLPNDDIRLFEVTERVYGILAAPPCTEFAVSGARWWSSKSNLDLLHGLSVLDACLRIIFISKPVFWCLENPVGRINKYIGPPLMYFNPCDYGDPYTKKTGLWGKFNKPVIKNPVEPTEGSKMHLYPPSKNRAALRAITPPGFAKAFFEANL